MVKIRPLIQVLGKIIKLPKNSYLDPETLGSGTTDATTVLKGDGTWGTPSSMGYVPYVGATQDVDLGIYKLSADAVEFSLTPTNAAGAGQIVYDGASGALSYLLNNSNVVSRIGQTMHAYVHNAEAVTITKGQAVYLFSASGNKASVKLAFNTSDATSAKTFGLAAENIGAGQNGMVICQGVLDGLNTGMYVAGNILYLGSTPGSYTATKPYAPNHMVYIGIVERANAGNGQIYVRVQNGYELDEIHDVDLVTTPPTTGNVLTYNGTLWVPQAPGGGGLTVGTTAIASGTVGRILFQNGGNVLGQDSALFWDNTNKRLGIGATPSTSVRLDIRSQGALSTDIAFRVRNSANNDNIAELTGNGLFRFGLTSGYHISLNPTSPSLRGQNGATVVWQLSPWTGEHSWLTANATNQNLIGIGTTSPTDKLHINNTINDYRIRISVGAANPADESCGIRFTTTWAGTSFGADAANLVVRTKGTNNISTQRTALEFRMNALGTSALRASLTGQSNLLLQSPTEDTNDVGVIYIPNGTAPTSSIVDGYKQYSADIVAGNAAPHFRTENGSIIKLFQGAALTASDGTLANAVTRIGELEARLKAHGLIA